LLVPQKPSYEKPSTPENAYGVVPNKIPYYVTQNNNANHGNNNNANNNNANNLSNNNNVNNNVSSNTSNNNAVMENPQKYLNAGDQRQQQQQQSYNKKHALTVVATPNKDKLLDIYEKGENGSCKDKEDLPEWMTFTKWGRRPKRRRMDLLEFL